MKTYTSKSNANRAAKSQKLQDYRIGTTDEGKFYIIEAEGSYEDFGGNLDSQAPRIAVKRRKGSTITAQRKSAIEGPVAAVWKLADEMRDARRKDVIQACLEAGIAYYTARTQYQRWYTAQKSKKIVDLNTGN